MTELDKSCLEQGTLQVVNRDKGTAGLGCPLEYSGIIFGKLPQG